MVRRAGCRSGCRICTRCPLLDILN